MQHLIESILEILEEECQVTIIGNPSYRRDKVVRGVITAASETYDDIAVIDWYGVYHVDWLPTVRPVLPYSKVAKYLPVAISSMPTLYRVGHQVEGLVYEAIEDSENFPQVISRLRSLSIKRNLARTILSRIIPLKEFFTEELSLPTKFRVDLHEAPILIRRVLSQLWIALACESLRTNALMVISEVSRAIKRGPWVWSLIDETEARRVRVLLVDSELLRVYLRHTVVFADYRPEESVIAHKYRLQALAEGLEEGKALLISSPSEHRVFKIE